MDWVKDEWKVVGKNVPQGVDLSFGLLMDSLIKEYWGFLPYTDRGMVYMSCIQIGTNAPTQSQIKRRLWNQLYSTILFIELIKLYKYGKNQIN